MKTVLLFILLICFFSPALAQDIVGKWYGNLNVQGMEIPLEFSITRNENVYSATMMSPSQGATEMPMDSVGFDFPDLAMRLKAFGISYAGKMNDAGDFEGTFSQQGFNLPLNFSHTKPAKKKHSQEPVAPFPYAVKEVKFKHKTGGFDLAGTLTMPASGDKFPAVILISGSGAQNRDEEILGHKPFLLLADFLTRKGIAVLRYDDRGTNQSGGDFATATTADLATDAEAALAFLRTQPQIDPKKIGLMGHSEGGIIAPMVAVKHRKEVAFVIMLAGTGIPGDSLLRLQNLLIAKAEGAGDEDLRQMDEFNQKIYHIVRTETDEQQLKTKLEAVVGEGYRLLPESERSRMTKQQFVQVSMAQIASPWMLYFLRHDPATNLRKVKCPLLALNGSKDLQVPATENLEAIKNALTLGKNKDFSCVLLPDLNHLFQPCITGSPSEYAGIDITISPLALNAISEWILKRF